MQKVFQNLDANETIFFARELEFIKSKSYDKLYPEFKATSLIPVSFDAGEGAETITYESYDTVGIMKIIANYADDLPRSDVKGDETSILVKSIGGSYGYSLQEIRNARMAGKPLPERKANAARKAYEQKINNIAWYADGSTAYGGMYGILYQPNVTKADAGTGSWISGPASADNIIKDVNTAINNVISLTKGVEIPDTVLLPLDEYGYIAKTPRASNSDTTILEFLKAVNPGVSFEWVNELADVTPLPSGGVGTKNLMLIYKKDPDKLTYELPVGFEQLPAQERNLEYVIATHARVAGVLVYYPLSIAIIEGI